MLPCHWLLLVLLAAAAATTLSIRKQSHTTKLCISQAPTQPALRCNNATTTTTTATTAATARVAAALVAEMRATATAIYRETATTSRYVNVTSDWHPQHHNYHNSNDYTPTVTPVAAVATTLLTLYFSLPRQKNNLRPSSIRSCSSTDSSSCSNKQAPVL